MNFGISEKCMELIINAISKCLEVEKAAIFGSRAMGNYKAGSDVDIAIYGKNVTDKIIIRLSSFLNEELPLPYYFDIIHYDSIKNQELEDHVDTYGKVIYKRG